jgi:predicted aconitase with swiveling domain
METRTMTTLAARTIVGGRASGPALVTRQPINFTAAMCKVPNMLPSKRAEIRDAHHELFRENVAGKVLVFPTCIGSTHTGLVLLDLVSLGRGPAALVVQHCDSLLISGVVLSEVWFERAIPILEYPADDLYDHVRTGMHVEVDGERGSVVVGRDASGAVRGDPASG